MILFALSTLSLERSLFFSLSFRIETVILHSKFDVYIYTYYKMWIRDRLERNGTDWTGLDYNGYTGRKGVRLGRGGYSILSIWSCLVRFWFWFGFFRAGSGVCLG